MQFVHLKTYSEFSLRRGTNKIKNLIGSAVKDNQPAMAITDLNGLHSAVGFYETARENGVKPIIGCDLTVEREDGSTYQLTVLAKNKDGYNSIVALNSRSYLEKNTKFDEARVKEDWIVDLNNVVVLSGGKDGCIGQYILKDDYEEAKLIASQLKDLFGDDFYIEIQRDSSKEQDVYIENALRICQEVSIPPVATHPVLFPTRDDFVAHEIRYCVANKQKFATVDRERPFNPDMHYKTTDEMVELFSDIPVAIENTVAIAQKCNLSLTLGKNYLPRFPTPNKEDEAEYFEKFSRDGLEKRLNKLFPNPEELAIQRKSYDERFERELGIIKKMEFPGYFLIVSDFINWAKDNDIPIGPGRGSGAGSLVAYAMGITDVDPLKYNLLFERFLNPERVSMPDFDIDMCQSRRGEIIEYVRKKYGSKSVCQIGTFSTMATKAVIRDVGRALDMHKDDVDSIAKMIFIPTGKHIPLKTYIWGGKLKDGTEIQADEKLLDRYNKEIKVRKLIDIALRLEGMTKNMGTHASGVLIAPGDLTDFTSLYVIGKDKEAPISQFHMGDVEKAGLVKFDFLGLKNLTVIMGALRLIEERRGKRLDLEEIDLQDPDVIKNIFANGNTTSVFQFESQGMKGVLKKAKPEKFEDLAALNALYRPGPMDIIPDYIAAKENPAKLSYPHPMLENILKETYGFMVYQEQVMQVAQKMGGYSLGGADLLRRAMGKKKVEEMQKHRQIFCDGAEKNGVDREKASEIFDLMEKFAGYGFNKSHAVAYSLIAYQTGFLKHYYPSEFLTSNLNLAAGSTEKIATLFADCRENNIPLAKVDVNHSDQYFKIESDGTIRYALIAIKGVAEKDVLEIQREREKNGPFIDMFDFMERLGAKGRAGKKTIEGLAKAGAFDSLEPNRAAVFEMVEEYCDYAKQYKTFVSAAPKRLAVIDDLVDVDTDVVEQPASEEAPKKGGLRRKSPAKAVKEVVAPLRPEVKEVEPWSELDLAKMEKEALGMYFSVDPFTNYYAKELSNKNNGFQSITPLNDLRDFAVEHAGESKYGAKTYIAGIIEEVFLFKENKGARIKISDGKSTIETVLFKKTFESYGKQLEEGKFVSLYVNAKIKETDENPDAAAASSVALLDQDGEVLAKEHEDEVEPELDVVVNAVFDFEQTKELLTEVLFVGIPDTPDAREIFLSIASQYPGTEHKNTAIVKMCLENPQTGERNKAGDIYSIKASKECVEDFQKAFGDRWVLRKYKEKFDKIIFPELFSNDKKNNKGWKNNRR